MILMTTVHPVISMTKDEHPQQANKGAASFPSPEKAKEDLIEKVSVAGWKEALSERVLWIRGCFCACLAIFSICCLCYSYEAIARWLSVDEYNIEFDDRTNQPSIPFSNVTICAQLYFNETFIKEHLLIPPKFVAKYAAYSNVSTNYGIKNTTYLEKREWTRSSSESIEAEFYNELSIYLSYISRPRFSRVNGVQRKIFHDIIRLNPQLANTERFYNLAYAQCEKMFQKCSFGGQEFDCCSKAILSFDDDGVCFLLKLNMDYDNAFPSTDTFHQTSAGPRYGLSVELSVNTADFPWFDTTAADDGFKVFVNPTPIVPTQSPTVAPHAAETFIKVTPQFRTLAKDCAPHGRLAGGNSKSGAERHLPYDPEGMNCLTGALEKFLANDVGCEPLIYLYRPNNRSTCGVIASQLIADAITFQITPEYLDSIISNGRQQQDRLKKKFFEKMDEIKLIVSSKGKCAPHCRYWTYDSSASFTDMIARQSSSTSDHHRRMYARIHIYYAELAFRQFEEKRQPIAYLAFCEFGNVIGFYWGMSAVSFFHVLYYSAVYYYAVRKRRNGRISEEETVLEGQPAAPSAPVDHHGGQERNPTIVVSEYGSVKIRNQRYQRPRCSTISVTHF